VLDWDLVCGNLDCCIQLLANQQQFQLQCSGNTATVREFATAAVVGKKQAVSMRLDMACVMRKVRRLAVS
jgi:hypothetical protein